MRSIGFNIFGKIRREKTVARKIEAIARYLSVLLTFILCTYTSFAQVNGQATRMATIQATERMLTNPGSGELSAFIDSKLSTSYRTSMTRDTMLKHLKVLRKAVAGAGSVDLALENDSIHLIFSGGADATIVIQLAKDDPGKIAYLRLKKERSEHERSLNEKRDAALRQRIRSLESLSQANDEKVLLVFAETNLTRLLRDSIDRERLFSMLRTIGRASAGAGEITVSPDSNGVHLIFRGSKNIDVLFVLEENEPFQISALFVDTNIDESDKTGALSIAPITWVNLRERLQEEEKAGFLGTVLVVRNGQIMLHEGFGMANAEQGIPNTTETIFDIGSTPIDFTRAAILKLQDEEILNLSDPISCFFSDIPPDKTSITVEHLMTGQSGLPNFHHIPEQDEDYDLTWIDRDEAVQRICNVPLLFSPGEDQSHSHSAFVLLAAVIEVVSGQSYADFLHQHFFEPIGMQHTACYGSNSGFGSDQMSVGYGTSKVGDVNIPLNWGSTSWLVMGSGGMVSNPGDMYRWVKAIHSGDLLSEEALDMYGCGNVYMGDSDRGFLFVYVDDPDNTVFVSSNSHTRSGDLSSAITHALVQLVTAYYD